jgi:hypothetical protein
MAATARTASSLAQDGEPQIPFAGYDRLDDRQVNAALSDHSQAELADVEDYERSHQNRESVLGKLRYMRGDEPFPGYDDLDIGAIVKALQDADIATVKRVRGYERKFGNRPDVLEEVARVHAERRAAQPATPAPSYEPMSATGSSREGDPGATEKAGSP